MKQYCRYCAYAFDYNGEGDNYLCLADAPCGENGAGKFHPASRAKRENKCKYFAYNELDVFYTSRNGAEESMHYKPRETRKDKLKTIEQVNIFDIEKERE